MPDTVPGTPTARWPIVLRPLMTLPSLSRYMFGGGRQRRLLAKIEEGLAAIGQLDGHEAAAAEIAGRRIDHGQRIAHGDRRIDRIAAALEHVDADLGRQVLRADDHAVFGGHGRRRGGVGGGNHQ